jgi:uncharacterized protein YqfA (UPF0365 family)
MGEAAAARLARALADTDIAPVAATERRAALVAKRDALLALVA